MNIFRKFLILVITVTTVGVSQAQKIESWEKTRSDKVESRKFKNNFYMTRSVFFANLNTVNFRVSSEAVNNQVSSISNKYTRGNFLYLNAELGFKYKLYKFKDFFSVAVVTYPNILLDRRFDQVLPFGIEVAMFNSSTYNNTNKVGFSMAFGKELGRNTDYNFFNNFVRMTLNYNKYKRKLKGGTKMVKGFFGFHYGFGDNGSFENKFVTFTDRKEFRIVIGRTFTFYK
jgi:hypothetical protein